jgi:ABC-2 type transport system ATP-binding protein
MSGIPTVTPDSSRLATATTAGVSPIRVVGLTKRYHSLRGDILAVDAIDLEVRSGEFFGLLGPNGAGKSTTIGMLTTRVAPTAGRAEVAGIDVVADPAAVKAAIGVVPQTNTLDRQLNVFDNLYFHGRYFGMSRRVARERTAELLERFSLADRAKALVQQLSGGMAQRLMFARAIMHRPAVLILDEPTSGIDPQTRVNLWELLTELNDEGQTILLTTHYMEEADRLCNRIAIVDHGHVLALGSPSELKAGLDADTLVTITFADDAAALLPTAEALPGVRRAEAEGRVLRLFARDAEGLLGRVVTLAAGAGASIRDASNEPPTLEAVFLALTGREYRE